MGNVELIKWTYFRGGPEPEEYPHIERKKTQTLYLVTQ